jgi:hypothetical protein
MPPPGHCPLRLARADSSGTAIQVGSAVVVPATPAHTPPAGKLTPRQLASERACAPHWHLPTHSLSAPARARQATLGAPESMCSGTSGGMPGGSRPRSPSREPSSPGKKNGLSRLKLKFRARARASATLRASEARGALRPLPHWQCGAEPERAAVFWWQWTPIMMALRPLAPATRTPGRRAAAGPRVSGSGTENPTTRTRRGRLLSAKLNLKLKAPATGRGMCHYTLYIMPVSPCDIRRVVCRFQLQLMT